MAKITNDSAPEPTNPDVKSTANGKSTADRRSTATGRSTPDRKTVPDTKVLPTEQLEFTPGPVSASAAASGGATGLPDASGKAATTSSTPRENLPIFRRHPVASGIVAGILAVLVVSSLTAWGVGTAVTASLTNQTAPVAAPSTATPAPRAGADQGGTVAGGRVAFRATIQSIDDSTWTILTKRGQTVSVTVNGSTLFGTKRIAETQSSFAVGDSVVIVATKVDGTATAVRVVNAADLRTAKGTGPGTGSDDNGTDGDQPAPTPTPTSTATT